MNKKKTMLVKLVSKASPYYYTTVVKRQQNRKKLSLKKYDPYLRQRLVFLEQKLQSK